MQRRYPLDVAWKVLIKDLQLDAFQLLRQAKLPIDLLDRAQPSVTADEYFRFWDSVVLLLNMDDLPLKLVQAVKVEAFNPLMFACLCSENLNIALQRFSRYKLLLGPLRLNVQIDDIQTSATFDAAECETPPPASLLTTEVVFLMQLARLATRQHLIPASVTIPMNSPILNQLEDYFGVPVKVADYAQVSFHAKDAATPFLTANESFWQALEPSLKLKLTELVQDKSFAAHVRASMVQNLASGQCTVAHIASQLAVSQRTLQRKLTEEGTNFQAELNVVRLELARHYLMEMQQSIIETAFLLGYDEPNSFSRAFQNWTGKTPEQYRRTS